MRTTLTIARPPIIPQQTARPQAYVLRPDIVRQGPQYPDVPREQLVEALRVYFRKGSQPHPRLKHLHNGVAVFSGYFVYDFNSKTKISYDIICRVPLTDPLFQTDQSVELLYCNHTCSIAEFVPISMQDKKGCGLTQPEY